MKLVRSDELSSDMTVAPLRWSLNEAGVTYGPVHASDQSSGIYNLKAMSTAKIININFFNCPLSIALVASE